MPKPLTCTIDIEEIAFGRVFRALNEMAGVISVNIHAPSPKPPKTPFEPIAKRTPGGSNSCIALAALHAAGADGLSLSAIGQAFEAAGRKQSSASDVMQILAKSKHVVRSKTQRGQYHIVPKGVTYLQTECILDARKGVKHG